MDTYDRQRTSKKILSLEHEGSLEEIMQLMEKSRGGRLISPRARSASNPAAARRDRSGEHRAVKFDTQAGTKRLDPAQLRGGSEGRDSAGEEDALELQGTQAKMHHPLQNQDPDYLSNFITQMYQTAAHNEVPHRSKARLLKDQLEASQPVVVGLNKKGEPEPHLSHPTLPSGLATEVDKPEPGVAKERQEAGPSRVIFDRVSPPNAAGAASSSAAVDVAAVAKTFKEPATTYADEQGSASGGDRATNKYAYGQKEGAISEQEDSLTTGNVISDQGGARARGHHLSSNQEEPGRKGSMLLATANRREDTAQSAGSDRRY